jgi:hypothetical protein
MDGNESRNIAHLGAGIGPSSMTAAQAEANAKRHRDDAWRFQALQLAAQTFGRESDADGIVKSAKAFENYLAGRVEYKGPEPEVTLTGE